jgi:hypothetical protein
MTPIETSPYFDGKSHNAQCRIGGGAAGAVLGNRRKKGAVIGGAVVAWCCHVSHWEAGDHCAVGNRISVCHHREQQLHRRVVKPANGGTRPFDDNRDRDGGWFETGTGASSAITFATGTAICRGLAKRGGICLRAGEAHSARQRPGLQKAWSHFRDLVSSYLGLRNASAASFWAGVL